MEFLYFTLAFVIAILIYAIISYYRVKKAVTTLSQEQFIEGYRKAQLIDVREAKEFAGGHILGARNIPQSQMKQRHKEIRSDKPVYLYDQNGARSGRVALFLKKRGYEQLYTLDGGFKKWTGKVRSK
ncbi:MAG TPA: rhodanese-like domain-containing protein [Planococcus sp. (in: firmicutes)]|nr:rhodanese-like domain-containing protein [Planococcus sp. (in: firmicutes)]